MTRIGVLYDSQIFQMQRYGGVSRYFHELIARATESADLDVSLFVGLSRNRYGTERLRHRCKNFWGIVHPDIPRTYPIANRLNQLLLGRFVRNCHPSVYHPTYYLPYLPEWRVPRVITVHDMIHERFIHLFGPEARPMLDLKRMAIAKADLLIAISQATKRDLMDILGVPESKIRVVYQAGAKLADHAPKPAIAGRYLLYVGLRGGYKNFETAVRAFAALTSAHRDLRLVCCGGNAFNRAERALFHQVGIENKIHQVTCNDAELAGYYQHALAFVFPSLYEGFGIPPLEAMLHGCPVVTSRTSSMPEVIGEAGLYFDPAKLDDLLTQLERVIDDSELRAQLSERGRERAQLFSWDRCCRDTIAVYQELAG